MRRKARWGVLRFAGGASLAALVSGCDIGMSGDRPANDSTAVPAIGIWPNLHERTAASEGMCEYLLTFDEQAERFHARVVESNVTVLMIPVTWSSVDTGNGSGPDFSGSGLLLGAIADGYDVFVNLAPIWSNRYTTPLDLGNQPFSEESPPDGGQIPLERTIERGRLLVAEMAAQVPAARDRVKYLSLGNEVDAFAGALDPSADAGSDADTGNEADASSGAGSRFPWRGFGRYVHEVGTYARVHFPHAKITVTFTALSTLSPAMRANMLALQDDTDVLALNYYGAGESAGDLTRAFEGIFGLFPADWPIVLQELGFLAPPDGEHLQVLFIEEAFRFGAAAGSRMPYMGFFSLHDWHVEPEPCEPIGVAYPCNPCEPDCRWCGTANGGPLLGLLSMVGLLREDGTAKQAWEPFKALASEFRARNRATRR